MTVETASEKKYLRVGENEQIFTKKSLKAVSDLRAKKILRKDEHFAREAAKQAASAELLLTQNSGFLEAENLLERTFKVRQDQLKELVDLQSAKKIFELKLQEADGPYRAQYTRNGRHVLLGGQESGHLAAFDWQSGKLRFEMNLEAGEKVHDVCWLQNETFFAAAQRKYVYVYDHVGREVHRLKNHSTAEHLAFLPYHFLLTSASRDGHLRYTDVTMGSLVADLAFYGTGACTAPLAVNPRSGIVNLGHANGTVTLWAPKMPAALIKILAHRGPVAAVAVSPDGAHLATAGVDGALNIWDLRTYRQALTTLNAGARVSALDFSQRGVLAVGHGPRITVWKDLVASGGAARVPYMNHLLPGKTVTSLRFCPYEDVLGVGHSGGFSSVLIPGSGEANFDAFEANPFSTVKQRREAEVHQFLEKLAPESIVLDPSLIGRVHRPSQLDIDADRQLEAAANNNSDKALRNRTKGRNSSFKRYLRKRQNVIDERKHEQSQKAAVQVVQSNLQQHLPNADGRKSALSRFIRKSDH